MVDAQIVEEWLQKAEEDYPYKMGDAGPSNRLVALSIGDL